MKKRKGARDLMVFDPYGRKEVRVIYTDGTTKTLMPGDRGHATAYRAAMRKKRK